MEPKCNQSKCKSNHSSREIANSADAPPNAPSVPNLDDESGGMSDIGWVTPDESAACHFGGFVHGNNYSEIRGYWRMSCPAAPVYY